MWLIWTIEFLIILLPFVLLTIFMTWLIVWYLSWHMYLYSNQSPRIKYISYKDAKEKLDKIEWLGAYDSRYNLYYNVDNKNRWAYDCLSLDGVKYKFRFVDYIRFSKLAKAKWMSIDKYDTFVDMLEDYDNGYMMINRKRNSDG